MAGCGGGSSFAGEPSSQTLTPLLLSVPNPPIPFKGSDGRVHLDYELWLDNFSSAKAAVSAAEISSGGLVLDNLKAEDVANQLQPAGERDSSGAMLTGTQSLLFLDVILAAGVSAPDHLSQKVTARLTAQGRHLDVAPVLENTPVNHAPVMVIGPPLVGANYVSADSCCTSSRHRRAALAVNGTVSIAQRYAVDWEELDGTNRIYNGPRLDLKSYTIFGKPVIAVANGTVVLAINDQPDQPPGAFPPNLTPDQVDGNAVILDLGKGVFALYAHMKKGSVLVHWGDTVVRGQAIGMVGNSGNTIAPHLHFQTMDAPYSLASSGVPYEIDSYQITALTPGTKAFDDAEANGTPLATTPVSPPTQVKDALPLDQLIISFGEQSGPR